MGKFKKTLLSLLLAGAGALAGARGLEGDIVPVNDVTDVVKRASENGGESSRYETNNLTYNGNLPEHEIILFSYKNVEGLSYTPLIGGLENDPSNPRQSINKAVGFINKDDATFWGLNPGDILGNTREGANVSGGFFAGIDFNKNSYIGDYNTNTGILTFEPGEYIPSYKIEFSGFSAFPETGNGTIESINIVPENSGIRNVNFQTEPINPLNTLQKSAFVSFSFIGDNIFQERPAGNRVLDAKYRISYLVDDGDNNSSNDVVVGSVNNHIIYSFPNQESIEHYRITDSDDPFYGDYEIPCFMFGGPEFSLGEQTGDGPFNLYAKVECLGQGDSQYIKFFPSYSDNQSVEKTPEPATLGLFGLGSLAAYFLRKRE